MQCSMPFWMAMWLDDGEAREGFVRDTRAMLGFAHGSITSN
jgi:hypothetical protein